MHAINIASNHSELKSVLDGVYIEWNVPVLYKEPVS